MSRGDFSRRLQGDAFRRPPSFWRVVHLDPWLLLGLLVLAATGLAVLYSASGSNDAMVMRQAVFLGIGFVGLVVGAQLNLRFVLRFAPSIYLLALILLLLVLLVGVGAKGAQRWLNLGVVRFQPSEIAKFAVPLAIAAYCQAQHGPMRFSTVMVCLGLIAVPSALIFLQPDLGTTLMVAGAGFIALFLAGLPLAYIVSAAVLAAASAPLLWHFGMHDYQKRRVLTLLDPSADPLGSGWNTLQAQTAIGSGGLSGKGYLEGTQSQLDFLPERHTDFIVAVVSEEFGWLGAIALIVLYGLITGRGLWIAAHGASMFSRILAGSISLTFLVYVVTNMGMVAGILPVVGVPLPMISLGGTALVSLLFGFGLVMAVATEPRGGTLR